MLNKQKKKKIPGVFEVYFPSWFCLLGCFFPSFWRNNIIQNLRTTGFEYVILSYLLLKMNFTILYPLFSRWNIFRRLGRGWNLTFTRREYSPQMSVYIDRSTERNICCFPSDIILFLNSYRPQGAWNKGGSLGRPLHCHV